MSDIKPCPFCGCELVANNNQDDLYVRRYGTHFNHPHVVCHLIDHEVSPSAVEDWNRRATPAVPAEPATEVEKLLPHAYLFAKVAMVMPLFEEARDALTALTEKQRIAHGISKSLADRMDIAGTYSIEDWLAATPEPALEQTAAGSVHQRGDKS